MIEQRIQWEARFWNKVDKSGSCWQWKAAVFKQGGYGHFRINDKSFRAHRLSWELANGQIPDGMCVLHACDNPPCVKPAHLWLGSHAENMADSAQKGRATNAGYKGEDCGNAKLTEQQALFVRAEYEKGNTTYKALGNEFGVTRQAIFRIVKHLSWSHLP